jgi:hypothetical protein
MTPGRPQRYRHDERSINPVVTRQHYGTLVESQVEIVTRALGEEAEHGAAPWGRDQDRRRTNPRVATQDLRHGSSLATATGAFICFQDEAGHAARSS